MLKITQVTQHYITKTVFVRQISSGSVLFLDQIWREENGLPVNPNSDGPLAHLPDYTFLDGRPTPLGSNQKKRLVKQQQIAAKIIEFNRELDFAKTRFACKQKEKEEKKQKALQNKLKPKGSLMLEKSSLS